MGGCVVCVDLSFSSHVISDVTIRNTDDAMRLPLQFYWMYFILLCTVIVAKITRALLRL